MVDPAARSPARTRLLDAAEELFYEHGIAATGVDAVLRRAQVAPATLYAHFPGKDHLVAGYLRRRHERWREAWDAALRRAGDDPALRALSLFDALEELIGEQGPSRGCAFLGAAVELTDPDHPAQEWLAADTLLLLRRLRQAATDLGVAEPDALAAELLAVYDGALAAHRRRTTTPDVVPPLPARALAAATLARHLPP